MMEIEHVIKTEMGIHARPALIITKEAMKYESSILFEANGRTANGKEIMEVMSLMLKKGDVLKIKISGLDENKAINILENILDI